MPTINKLDTILDTLSHNEVELLIRKYIGRHQQLLKEGTPVNFQIRSKGYDERDRRGYWTVGNQYGSNNAADGEILHEVVKEHCRRTGFTSTLLLLEADPIEGEAE